MLLRGHKLCNNIRSGSTNVNLGTPFFTIIPFDQRPRDVQCRRDYNSLRGRGWVLQYGASWIDTIGGSNMKTEKREIKPICPHCETEVDRLIEVKEGWFADKRVYCCPHCKKILGVNFRLP